MHGGHATTTMVVPDLFLAMGETAVLRMGLFYVWMWVADDDVGLSFRGGARPPNRGFLADANVPLEVVALLVYRSFAQTM
jgi:hypothetical protein